MLSFPDRIQLSYQTLKFLTPKIEKIGEAVKKTNNANKLQKLLDELNVLRAKFDREKLIIDDLIKESGQEMGDSWKE